MNRRIALVSLAAACAVGSLAACGDDAAAPKGSGVAITATDKSCEVAKTTFDPGKVTFTISNKGDQTTEVYIYGQQGEAFTKVVAEMENIGPGLSRDLTADLAGGKYEIACKPGQSGNGIRTPITVTGTGDGAAPSATAAAVYDREIEVEVTATGVEGADGITAKNGEKIEFKLENKATAERALEILDPTGKVVAEVEAPPNGEAETIVTLTTPGTWKLRIEGQGVEKTFTVA